MNNQFTKNNIKQIKCVFSPQLAQKAPFLSRKLTFLQKQSDLFALPEESFADSDALQQSHTNSVSSGDRRKEPLSQTEQIPVLDNALRKVSVPQTMQVNFL